jgi:hypothetical protein
LKHFQYSLAFAPVTVPAVTDPVEFQQEASVLEEVPLSKAAGCPIVTELDLEEQLSVTVTV